MKSAMACWCVLELYLPQGYVQNQVAIDAYSDAIATGQLATAKGYAMTEEDQLHSEIIERIMCDFGVDIGAICARHGAGADAMLKSEPRLKQLVSDGVVEIEGNSLKVTDQSRFLVRSVAAAFDTHHDQSQRPHGRAM